MKKKILLYLFFFILFIPVFMWLAWYFTPNTKLVIAIVDKTVLTKKGQEHISLNWVLNHEKFTKTSQKPYHVSEDYFGFFPQENEKYNLKGLERFSDSKLQQLSLDADMAYFTDTYGIYNNEWFQEGDISARSGILYGGLSNKDLQLLENLKERHKLVIAEFNTFGSPTSARNRRAFEQLFHVKWTGWTARYFENLDIVENKEIPKWLVSNYRRAHQNKWPFKNAGVAFVNDHDEVVILEEGQHLENAIPVINTIAENQQKFGLPEDMNYPFWFDVIVPDPQYNEVISWFELDYTAEGLKEIQVHNIPKHFPAVTGHKGQDYQFYYFSGDFSDNPVSLSSSYLKGIEYLKGLFYDSRNVMERKKFFWNFYRPLVTTILDEYSEELPD